MNQRGNEREKEVKKNSFQGEDIHKIPRTEQRNGSKGNEAIRGRLLKNVMKGSKEKKATERKQSNGGKESTARKRKQRK